MTKAIGKRAKQNPFDYQQAELFSLEGVTDPFVNNSYYFSAHSATMSFFTRLGKRIDRDETWFALYLDGKVYSLGQELFPAGASPIKIEKTGENWTVSYRGILKDKDEIDFQGTFIGREKPLDFTSNMPAVRMATGMANEKWNKAFFEEVQKVSGQCHYEQEGLLEGTLTLDGKPCRGILEIGFNRDKNRYLNQREIDGIRR